MRIARRSQGMREGRRARGREAKRQQGREAERRGAGGEGERKRDGHAVRAWVQEAPQNTEVRVWAVHEES